jgi:hypothetical protein
MEIVDGEMEALSAGEWRAFETGTREYHVTARAAANLPPGRFYLTVEPGLLKLEWKPAVRQHGGDVRREVKIL